jgi:hypothetical protein
MKMAKCQISVYFVEATIIFSVVMLQRLFFLFFKIFFKNILKIVISFFI